MPHLDIGVHRCRHERDDSAAGSQPALATAQASARAECLASWRDGVIAAGVASCSHVGPELASRSRAGASAHDGGGGPGPPTRLRARRVPRLRPARAASMNNSATRPSASSRATRPAARPVVPQGPLNRPRRRAAPTQPHAWNLGRARYARQPALHLGRHQPGPPDRRAGRNARGLIEHAHGHRRWMRRITGSTALRTVPLRRDACPKPVI